VPDQHRRYQAPGVGLQSCGVDRRQRCRGTRRAHVLARPPTQAREFKRYRVAQPDHAGEIRRMHGLLAPSPSEALVDKRDRQSSLSPCSSRASAPRALSAIPRRMSVGHAGIRSPSGALRAAAVGHLWNHIDLYSPLPRILGCFSIAALPPGGLLRAGDGDRLMRLALHSAPARLSSLVA
jgi:hypothetical protein